ncbi:MAG: S8 family peptidase [Leptothrix sp. (in: b-proteobacteria)]
MQPSSQTRPAPTPARRRARVQMGAALTLLGCALAALGVAQAFESSDRAQGVTAVAAEQDREGTDRLIVKYRSAANATALDARALSALTVAGNRAGVQIARLRGTSHGSHVLRTDRRLSLTEARALAAALRSGDADVEYAEPDRILQAQYVPNDAMYATSQWNLSEPTAGIRAESAWNKSTGTGVVVAVIDTGVRRHADLAANLLAGYDFITDTVVANDGNGRDADPTDPGDWAAAGGCGVGSAARNSSWHGTHVAGTIAAVTGNGVGVAGIAFGAKVLPVRVLGRCGGYTSDIADGIVWASGGTVPGVPANPTPARVINLSLGGAGACDVTTQNAINSARSRGTVVVVAAGNSAADAAGFSPASCAGVISVAAVGRAGNRASYSNFGASVDVAAPGGDSAGSILSTLNAGTTKPGVDSYAGYNGTSMATPHVAAIAALMLSRVPTLTPDQVEAHIKTAAAARGFPQPCVQCGVGLVDASASIDAALGIAPPPPPPPPVQVGYNEVEPNNTMTTPQAIASLQARITGTMASATDTDCYATTLAAGKTIKASLTPNATSDYDLTMYWPSNSNQPISTSALGVGSVDSVSTTNATGATLNLSVCVYYYSGVVGTGGTYTLTLAQ